MTPKEILNDIYSQASVDNAITVDDLSLKVEIDEVCRCATNRACVRLLMSCLLAKLDNSTVDVRKPYTEIGTSDCFSGRTYDELYISSFIAQHRLPCNSTTAFLTPSFRNIDKPLTEDVKIIGRPRDVYVKTLDILKKISDKIIDPRVALIEIVRVLLKMRDEALDRMNSLLRSLEKNEDSLPLSSEAIIKLIEQHLACKNSSRLPVLIVAAAYVVTGEKLGEKVLPLNAHNAADLQTGALGDVEICLVNDNDLVTVYEMKMKPITKSDIDIAVNKIVNARVKIDNYIFITTDAVNQEVFEYAFSFYEKLCGIELAILDCAGFLRHFLHFFHRIRMSYLDTYQSLVLNEPDSAVNQSLKEAFLALRKVAEAT